MPTSWRHQTRSRRAIRRQPRGWPRGTRRAGACRLRSIVWPAAIRRFRRSVMTYRPRTAAIRAPRTRRWRRRDGRPGTDDLSATPFSINSEGFGSSSPDGDSLIPFEAPDDATSLDSAYPPDSTFAGAQPGLAGDMPDGDGICIVMATCKRRAALFGPGTSVTEAFSADQGASRVCRRQYGGPGLIRGRRCGPGIRPGRGNGRTGGGRFAFRQRATVARSHRPASGGGHASFVVVGVTRRTTCWIATSRTKARFRRSPAHSLGGH